MGLFCAGKQGKNRRLLPVLIVVAAFSPVLAQSPGGNGGLPVDENREPGESAAAEQYLRWAEQAAAGGRWSEALAALERAADFADVSSDLSYLLAVVRSREGKSRGAVLEALERALDANRWGRYSPSQARLLEAEQLVAVRNYSGALASLAQIPDNADTGRADGRADTAVLRLTALKGLLGVSGAGEIAEFRRRMFESLDRYPRDTRPLRVFFDYARNRNPDAADQDLMALALRRLSLLVEADPELAWMAAPFIRDTEEARRLVSAYRAGGLGQAPKGSFRPNPASIAEALNLGLIDDAGAVEEFFVPPVIDRDLIVRVSGLLRSDQGRKQFTEKLLAFSGTITADDDRDGYPESRALYRAGTLLEYNYDADQDGLTELLVSFNSGGSPQWAELAVLPDIEAERAGLPLLPVRDEDRRKALVRWERYPSVLRTELGGTSFIPGPGDFQFGPIRFIELAAAGGYGGLLFPRLEPRYSRLTLRTLVSFAVRIERPGAEFEGALEQIDLDRGIPLRAVETLNGQIVSETVFEKGKPILQRLDLDLDSRMETLRRFRPPEGEAAPAYPFDYRKYTASSESDWDNDGVYESAEAYRQDGSVVYSWDMDEDGIKEYSETKNRD
jgi:hypothetical protein